MYDKGFGEVLLPADTWEKRLTFLPLLEGRNKRSHQNRIKRVTAKGAPIRLFPRYERTMTLIINYAKVYQNFLRIQEISALIYMPRWQPQDIRPNRNLHKH